MCQKPAFYTVTTVDASPPQPTIGRTTLKGLGANHSRARNDPLRLATLSGTRRTNVRCRSGETSLPGGTCLASLAPIRLVTSCPSANVSGGMLTWGKA